MSYFPELDDQGNTPVIVNVLLVIIGALMVAGFVWFFVLH